MDKINWIKQKKYKDITYNKSCGVARVQKDLLQRMEFIHFVVVEIKKQEVNKVMLEKMGIID